MTKTERKRRRASVIIKNIRRRDKAIKEKRTPIRRVGNRRDRLFVRSGAFSKTTRRADIGRIRKTARGFRFKLGGPIKGTPQIRTSRKRAENSINRHHDKFLVTRLGKTRAKNAKRIFRIKTQTRSQASKQAWVTRRKRYGKNGRR